MGTVVVRTKRTFPIPSTVRDRWASTWDRVASDPVLPAGTRGSGSFARRPIRGLETSFSHLANATLLPRLRLPAPSVGAAVGTPINFIWLKLMGTVSYRLGLTISTPERYLCFTCQGY